jgi:ATP-dependent Lhr-like helicase
VNAHALKGRLPRTWGAFFGRYGNFTPIQQQAIPLLLEGRNTLLSAGTASGKTEAALAPLIERHLPPNRPPSQLSVLYLLPTRALINGLLSRLTTPLNALQITLAAKTHDFNSFHPRSPSDVLLTTPESLDSLLAAEPKTLIHVRAVIVDELHAFDASVRGDQLRVLLNRLRALRAYAFSNGDAADDVIQYTALSATLAEPETSATRYFPDAYIVRSGGQRPLHQQLIPLDEGSVSAFIDYLDTFRQQGWKKALVFCNTRAEVEFYASQLHAARSPFGKAIYVVNRH